MIVIESDFQEMIKTSFDQLEKGLKTLIKDSDKKFLIIHSDLTKIGLYLSKNKNILEDLSEIISNKVICIPAFTINSFTSKGIYRPQFDRPEVGSMGEIARKLGWMRTNNPMHSFFINKPINKKLHFEYQVQTATSSFSNSSFLADIENDTLILQIGCFQNTYVHRAENIFKVDYRYSKIFKGKWQNDLKQGNIENEMIVRDTRFKGIDEIDRSFAAYEFFECDYCKSISLNNCLIRAFSADNYLDFTIDKLNQNKYYLTSIN